MNSGAAPPSTRCRSPVCVGAGAAGSQPVRSGPESPSRAAVGTSCATAPKANPARSRIVRSCAPTRTSSWKALSSLRSRSMPRRPSSVSRRAFDGEIERVTQAVEEFQSSGLCSNCTVTIVAGPDEYLFGEEKAMLEVIEGNEPLPRWLPPYLHGLFATAPQLGWQSAEPRGDDATEHGSNPTLVNNVETLSNVPHILARAPTGSGRWARRSRRAPSWPPSSAT